MRVIKWLLGIAAGMVLIFVVVGLLLPREVTVSRSVTIDAPPATVFEIVNSWQRFNEWSPWADIDPDTAYTYSGPRSGVGAVMSWQSDDPSAGVGRQEIIISEPDRRVVTALDFGDMGKGTAEMLIEPRGEQTVVNWGFHTDFGYRLVFRWMGLMFDRMLGPSYETGLERLKALAEADAGNS